jgi:acetate kinase
VNILVINCGSSSVKAGIVKFPDKNATHTLVVERIGRDPKVVFNGNTIQKSYSSEYVDLLKEVLHDFLEDAGNPDIDCVGHRVVHGGEHYAQPVIVDDAVKTAIREMFPLVPLHNPVNLKGIEVAEELFPDKPQIAVFDTAFHRSIPNRAQFYAIDKELADEKRIRRFGFHGTSHHYVSKKAAQFLHADLRDLRLITCHLGSGCSITAVEFGRSVETSMGMSALEGLVMGTRSGDIDPGVLTFLMREGMSADQISTLLNENSGLLGLSGVSNDMREVLAEAEKGNERCRLAIQVFTHRLRKYIGAYAAAMGGVDAIVFTGGIGENSAEIRHRATQRFDFLGAVIDEDKNRDIRLGKEQPVAVFSTPNSRVKLLAVLTDEQMAIAIEAEKIVSEKFRVNTLPPIPIAISARHIHLTQESVDALFGKGYQLTFRRPLSQPGQYSCEETLTIVGPKNSLDNVRILGPVRQVNQVEISRTDEFFLGVDAPVRDSGHVEGTPGITLIGPKGSLTLKEGLICAWRHIHMHPDDAALFGVEDKDIVEVDIDDEFRPLTFKNVLVRVSDKFKLEMHIDTDEGNAAQIESGVTGSLTTTGKSCRLKKKKV